MAVERWLIVNTDGAVCNVILWDAEASPDWMPPEDCTVQLDDGSPIIIIA
jgi:hypothetical protein